MSPPDELSQAASVFGIRLRADPELTFEGSQIAFRAESGVSIIFNAENGDFQLSSMNYYSPPDQIRKTEVSDHDEFYNSGELKTPEVLQSEISTVFQL